MKGVIQADHIAVNNYELKVVGLVTLTAVKISGIEDELITIQLPDRTTATGGVRNPTEFDMEMPLHHKLEQAAMELWYKESQEPVSPTYKKPCTLLMRSITGNNNSAFTLVGVFPKKRTLPDLEMENDGEQAVVVWTMSVDDIVPF